MAKAKFMFQLHAVNWVETTRII